MLLTMTRSIPFTVPLTGEDIQTARKWGSTQFHPQRAQQVYANVLASGAVRFYLNCMEIQTEESRDCHRSAAAFDNFSTVEISGIGTLECCPILPGDRTVRIPAETWGDRLGYMAVRLDESFANAELVGFIKKATREMVSLDSLESLDNFLNYICDLEDAIESRTNREPIQLFQWWNDAFEAGWETLESLFPKTQLAWRYRGVPTPTSDRSITRAKILNLNIQEPIALAIEMVPMEDSEITHSEVEIWVKLCPLETDTHLPENLRLSVLDEANIEVIQAEARTTDNIQVKFIAESGERFGVRVALNEAIVTESFLV